MLRPSSSSCHQLPQEVVWSFVTAPPEEEAKVVHPLFLFTGSSACTLVDVLLGNSLICFSIHKQHDLLSFRARAIPAVCQKLLRCSVSTKYQMTSSHPNVNDRLQPLLEELQLIHCSLLPDEHLIFTEDHDFWLEALLNPERAHDFPVRELSTFEVRIEGIAVWFEISVSEEYPLVSVKGEDISRGDQERWGVSVAKIRASTDEENQYPIYDLVSLNLLPSLRAEFQVRPLQEEQDPTTSSPSLFSEDQPYHVLFTSHHLISPHKRRSLQEWSSSLSITGFAKVGYPGIIYAEGKKENLEEFVHNVKEMQWLALKVRLMEPLPLEFVKTTSSISSKPSWSEFQKVGEVVEVMRKLGRDQFIVQMGIGSSG
ncbi:hypothetical protein CPB83DRAFT_360193 [Crepidotus variabilis]|uniref:Small nuclear ribonucleoprotein Prp3 C-terminal domain-containing protein n=1 Tax=Crepidotus variabilis TaxID=179855 RepID=A0A9P6EER2_9AGAR|nr:hypothetical protein CPB83DRAFT_360193 [Crepidotus variabilis]